MTVSELSVLIKEAILERDSVALPGLGRFVAEVVPSSFSDRGYSILPPYRRLVFDHAPLSDTFLSDLHVRKTGMDAASAADDLERTLREVEAELRLRKTVPLPGLGRLRATRENHFFFISDEDLDIYPDGFALESVSLKARPVARVAAVAPAPAVDDTPVGTEAEAEAPAPDVVTAPEPQAAAGETPSPQLPEPARRRRPRKRGRVFLTVVSVLAGLSLAALAALAVAGRVRPSLVDPLLYSPDELEIVNSGFVVVDR